MSDDLTSLDDFDGTARLFPLPNLVLFPCVIQPLHIFEPRYRQMTADALGDDRLIALVLLKPGWEADYEGRPAVHAVACLGKVVADKRLEDGRYNLLLRGLRRVRILAELPHDDLLYRTARVEVLEETEPDDPEAEAAFRRRVGELVPRWLQGQTQALDQLRRLLDSDLPAGILCDIVAFLLPLEVPFKQALLEEVDVARRMEALLDHMKANAPKLPAPPADRKFPPEFSPN